MERFLRGRLLAAAMVLSTVPLWTATPAYALVSVDISFDSFHDQLSRYGDWVYSDRWGTVWQPGDVPDDFRPYDTGGHWEYTGEYGWTWISDYAWGDVAFHYGRWVYDPDDGWLWIPGYVWSPAWVVWRGNNDYVGWMPMPPDDNFLSGHGDIGVSVSWGDPDRYYTGWYGPSYGGGSAMWVFVNFGHMGDRDYHRYAARRDQVPVLVRQTTNITNYTVVNNYVVNKSVDVHRVERMAGHPIQTVPARTVMRNPALIGTVAHGDQMRAQMIRMAPRGMGKPNSAPPPPPAIINRLSDHAVARGHQGGPSQHLFTKSALARPEAASHFRGGPAGPTPQAGPARMQTAPETSRPQRLGPENGMNAPRAPAPEYRPTNRTGFDRGPDNMPRNQEMNGPVNAPGPDNGGPTRMNHRAPQDRMEPSPESKPSRELRSEPAPRAMSRPESGPPRELRTAPAPRAVSHPPERMHEKSAPPPEQHQERGAEHAQPEKKQEKSPPQ